MAYGARLESVLGASPRGFESPILRHIASRDPESAQYNSWVTVRRDIAENPVFRRVAPAKRRIAQFLTTTFSGSAPASRASA